MSDTAASSGSGDTAGSSFPSADVAGGLHGPSVTDLTAKYAHLMDVGESADAGEGAEGESGDNVDGPVKPPIAAKVIPPVPYAEFQKSRAALRQERERAARAEAQNSLLMSQFEALQQAIQNGGAPPATDEAEETDLFRDPAMEALEAKLARLEEIETRRNTDALASQMEQEWAAAVQAHPHIADASDLVMTLMQSDSSLSVSQAVAKLLRIAPAPASTPAPRVAPVRQQTPPIRPLPSNGSGVTVPVVAAPKSFGDISKNILAKMAGR